MAQVNVKGSEKRSEVETLECTDSCNSEDLISSLSRSLTRCESKLPKTHTQPPNLVLLQYHGEHLFTTR